MPFPQAPSRRIALDDDGTVALFRNISADSVWTQVAAADLVEANDEETVTIAGWTAGGGPDQYRHCLIFPELREFDGVFVALNQASRSVEPLDTSADTTSGLDGTWTNRIADLNAGVDVYSAYRTGITSAAVSGIRGLRFRTDNGNSGKLRAVHVYGEISPGQTPDRLLFIDEATGLEFTIPQDWGDTPRGSSEDKEWRIKNNSAALTATTIQYTVEALFLGSASWYTHTLPGGGTFQATQQVASLAPATTTGIIKTRRITPGTELPGPHAARLYLNTGSWS